MIGAESEGDVGDRHRASAARSRIIMVITQTVGCYLRQSGAVIILLGYSHRCYLSYAVYTPTTASAAITSSIRLVVGSVYDLVLRAGGRTNTVLRCW